MKTSLKIIFIVFLATLVLSGCNNLSTNKKTTKIIQNETISFPINNVPDLNASLSFLKPICSEIKSSSGHNRSKINEQFCKKYYGDNSIAQDNFVLTVTKTNDRPYVKSDIKLLKSRFTEPGKKPTLENFVKKYDDYTRNINEEYKIALFLDDSVGHNEIGRWYLTKNTLNLKKDDLQYWFFCEAGCSLWPEDILGDYILWKYELSPSTGAGNKCWRITENERGNYEEYEGDKQAKCDMSIYILENIGLKFSLN